jgi:single-stranded-DNA-specific exonuclease
MSLAGVNPEAVDEEDIGFGLAPRLNALGRLDDANSIVEFLTTEDLSRARILASQLEALNERRKLACDQVQAAAQAKLKRNPDLLADPVLVLAEPTWPAGVIGIVANRLVDQYQRPVVLLANPEHEVARGSARSIPGCHITEAIATQSALLEGFGGHAMAAGLAIEPDRIPAFRRGLARAVAEQLEHGRVASALQLHGYVALGELSLALVTELERLAPFGPGNPPLILAAQDLKVIAKRPLGRGGHHLRVTVEDPERVTRNVVWWNWRDAPLPEGRFDLAFTVRANEFRGNVDIQLVWEDARIKPGTALLAGEGVAETSTTLDLLDFRSLPEPEARSQLATLTAGDRSVAVWAEGPERHVVSGCTRDALEPARILAIWTAPPGLEALHVALNRVNPVAVALFERPAMLDRPRPFLEYLTGLVKYALRERDGRTSIPELAAAMGHREVAVRLGLTWMAAKGYVRVRDGGDLVTRLSQDALPAPDEPRAHQLMEELALVLAETAAYRRFFVKSGEISRKRGIDP